MFPEFLLNPVPMTRSAAQCSYNKLISTGYIINEEQKKMNYTLRSFKELAPAILYN